MKTKILLTASVIIILFVSCTGRRDPVPAIGPGTLYPSYRQLDTSAPSETVKFFFAHHSTGSAWIASGNGNLGTNLNNNNYYVTESDYDWEQRPSPSSPTPIGSYTDTIHRPYWFTDDVMPYVYANTSHYDYSNVIADPGGENEIIMVKSCFPNSEVGSSITDEQDIYNGLLAYMADHTDKMFILVIPPPEIDISSASLTRQISNWLADRENGWLAGYEHNNVYAFDYYNVLTAPENHHWVVDSCESHEVNNPNNELYYPTGDSHPSSEGHQKATAEFIHLLNGWYNLWKEE